jgi:hypothetical protein
MRPLSAAILLLALLLPATSHAAWGHDPVTGSLSVCTATANQFPTQAVPDGAGGMIVAWHDLRSAVTSLDIYVQRINAAGQTLWGNDGLLICGAASGQVTPQILADGAGGAFFTWVDARSGSNDIFAQRVSAAGVPQWTTDGVAVAAGTSNQTGAKIVTDGAGGVIIAWLDNRNAGINDIYGQRLNAAGTALWTANGAPLATTTTDQQTMVMVADAAGGAFLAWQDYRNATADIYVQRVTSAAAVLYGVGGSTMCQAVGAQAAPAICSDAVGGCYVTWQDARSGTNDIYIQHLLAGSVYQFISDGIPVCNATADQTAAAIAPDGSGGAVITWQDLRSSTSYDIDAQRMTATGTMLWTANGVAVQAGTGDQTLPVIAGDNDGGAIICWQDTRSAPTDADLYAQHVSGTGTSLWSASGVAVSTAASSQTTPFVVPDGLGGAMVAWNDSRYGTYDVFAQRVDRYGYLGGTEPSIVNVKDVPNDQGSKVKVTWNASWLDLANNGSIASYAVYRAVPTLAPSRVQRARAFDPAHAAATGWEFVGSVAATHFLSTYGYIATTTSDSIAAGNPKTAFMVVGLDAGSSRFWISAADSGYSVDNIPPTVPAPFLGQYNAGQAKLHWDPVAAPDLAGYKLYRGNNPTFVPGAATLLTTRPDTGYVDNAGAAYVYKLTSVDVHGNESNVATWYPSNALAVGDGNAAALAFAAPSPNPARGATTLRYTLAAAGHVRLAVFDASGRRVRMLADAAQEAGAHEEAFELADDQGRALPPGLYLARLEAFGRVITKRIAAVR